MGYSNKTREKAFEHYFNDTPIEQVPKLLDREGFGKPSTVSVWKWHKKYNWLVRKKDLQEKSRVKVGEKLVDIKVRQQRIARKIQEKVEAQLDLNELSPKAMEALKAMAHELLLMGEATERIESKDILDVDRVKEIYDRIKKENKQ